MALLAVACTEGVPTGPDAREPIAPPAPVPGWLELRLTTPWPDDGAVQLTVLGGAVDEVAFSPGLTGYVGLSSSTTRILAAGAIGTGTVARLRVPDLGRAAGYRVTIGQVARRNSYALRASTDGYRAEVVR